MKDNNIAYNKGLKLFINEVGDSEKDFLNHEIQRLKNEISEIEKENKNWRDYKEDLKANFKALRVSETIQKFEDLIFDYEIKLDRFPKEDVEYANIDLSNSKGTEKIIMLYKLGIIDFLRDEEPFKLSTNSLASVLSCITGEKNTTIQSYLNPIISDNTDQKNNPLNSQKTVEKVNQNLISIGFKSSK